MTTYSHWQQRELDIASGEALDRLTDHDDRYLRQRELRSIHDDVFTNIVEVEMTAHRGCGATIKCEVDFTQTMIVPATFDDPGEGGDTDIVSVRPFEYALDKTTGRTTTRKNCLPCPTWLQELLIECIDRDELVADRD